MAWRILAGIGHGRPSLLVVALAVILAFSTATNGGSAPSSAPDPSSSISDLLNNPCFQRGRKGAHAISLTSQRPILDLNGDALLTPASTTTLITSAAAVPRLSRHDCQLVTVFKQMAQDFRVQGEDMAALRTAGGEQVIRSGR